MEIVSRAFVKIPRRCEINEGGKIGADRSGENAAIPARALSEYRGNVNVEKGLADWILV